MNTKKILSLLLSLIMMFSLTVGMNVSAFAVEDLPVDVFIDDWQEGYEYGFFKGYRDGYYGADYDYNGVSIAKNNICNYEEGYDVGYNQGSKDKKADEQDGDIDCNHDFNGDYVVTKDADCVASGQCVVTCVECEDSVCVYIPAIKHISDKGTVTTASTCTATGKKIYKCVNCGAILRQTSVKMKGHTPVVDKAVAATCTKTGLTEGSHCSVCKAVLVEQKTVGKIAHKAGKGVVTKKATCTETGVMTYACVYCGKKTTKSIDKIAHTEDKGTVTKKSTTSSNGTKVYKCSACKATLRTQTIKKIGVVDIATKQYTYDGTTKKPAIIIKNSDGTTIPAHCYTVTYSNNKYVGKATVKIVMNGNYGGTFTRTFNINPKGTSLATVTATTGGFKATWKKQATQTTGYILQYSLNSDLSNYSYTTITSNGTLSKSISSLSKGKKYYVRVRTYKVVNGVKYYSGWSSKMAVTTKK